MVHFPKALTCPMQLRDPAEKEMYENALEFSLSFSPANLSGIKSNGFSQIVESRAIKYGKIKTVVSLGRSLPSKKIKYA